MNIKRLQQTEGKGGSDETQDGGSYIQTLAEVIVSKEGSSLNFIDQSEFDAIK